MKGRCILAAVELHLANLLAWLEPRALLLALALPPVIRVVGHWIPEELFMVALGVLAARSDSAMAAAVLLAAVFVGLSDPSVPQDELRMFKLEVNWASPSSSGRASATMAAARVTSPAWRSRSRCRLCARSLRSSEGCSTASTTCLPHPDHP